MTVNAYSYVEDRRVWAVNQLVELDRHDLVDELTGGRREPRHARRRTRLRRTR